MCEVKKRTLSINYIHEAHRNYLQSYQEVSIKNEPHRINCEQLYESSIKISSASTFS